MEADLAVKIIGFAITIGAMLVGIGKVMARVNYTEDALKRHIEKTEQEFKQFENSVKELKSHVHTEVASLQNSHTKTDTRLEELIKSTGLLRTDIKEIARFIRSNHE